MGRLDRQGKLRRYRRWARAAYALATRTSPFGFAKAMAILAGGGGAGEAGAVGRDAAARDVPAVGERRQAEPVNGPSRASLEAQREVEDMGHVWVAFAGGALFLGLATLLSFLWGLQTVLGRPPEPPGLRATALAHAGDSATVMRFRSRAPGLFPDPPGDLRRFRAAQGAQGTGYAWIDRRAGIISIPVEQAMARIAAAGWPQWDSPARDTSGPARPGRSEAAKGNVP